jgi:hypothetical protein
MMTPVEREGLIPIEALGDDECTELRGLIRKGLTDIEAAAHMRVNPLRVSTQIAKWMRDEPDFMQSLGTLEARRSAAKKIYDERVMERMGDIVEAQIDAATNPEEPSVPAQNSLLDRVFGKAVDNSKVTLTVEQNVTIAPEERERLRSLFGMGEIIEGEFTENRSI